MRDNIKAQAVERASLARPWLARLTVREAGRLAALFGVERAGRRQQSPDRNGACITMSPAYHGLASEARSTGCQPNERVPLPGAKATLFMGQDTTSQTLLP
jgi:hypothetical protein